MEEDIEKESLKEQLLRQEKMAAIGQLSAGIAHEVQNPLNFVLNFSRLSTSLVADLKDVIEENGDRLGGDAVKEINEIADDLTENMNKIVEHGSRALSIVRGILLQSRGKQNEFLPTDVPALIHEYVWLSYHAARATDRDFNLSIVEDYPQRMPKVMVVPQDLSRAVVNVLNNSFYAVKEQKNRASSDYTPEVKITVTCTDESQGSVEITITFTDNGTGMTPQTKEKLFENFYTTKPAGKGTGLGMGIIKQIIEEHNGTIDVESAENEGTTMTFTISAKTIR